MGYYVTTYGDTLAHHGILGMKWGVRRYQNEDGSLTSAGRLRYYGAGGDRKGYYREIGAAKRYKDSNREMSRRLSKSGGKKYREWVKADPRNRRFQRTEYEKQRMIKEMGGSKSYADARYAYDHARLAKYVNRDGSLTTAGKLKYWDTNKERGKARLQRDLERDKNSRTRSQKDSTRVKLKNAKEALGVLGDYGVTQGLVGASIASRQKDPTKYIRKNAKAIGKTTRRLAVNALTGNVVGGAINTARLSRQLTVGTARAARKTVGRVAGNATRAGIGATIAGVSAGRRYANPYVAGRTIAKNIRKANDRDQRVINGGYYSRPDYIERRSRREKKLRDAVNYSYDTNMQTMKNIAGAITDKKRKRK